MTNAQKNDSLVTFANQILYKKSLPEGLPLISHHAKEIIGADRCSMFIYSPKKSELWTTLADGVERITVESKNGIVGETLRIQEAIIENDVSNNKMFHQIIDTETGYTTKNMITFPLFSHKKEIVGVLQLLNKDGGFDESDLKYMKYFSRTLSDFIELVNLYEG